MMAQVLQKYINNFGKLLQIVIAWAGFRWDVGISPILMIPYFFLTAGIFIVPFFLNQFGSGPTQHVALIALAWSSYYIGNSLLLTVFNKQLISALGEKAAWQFYVVSVGSLFGLQGAGLSAACQIGLLPITNVTFDPFDGSTFTLSGFWCFQAGCLLFVIGVATKLAASWTAGLDIYYYKDMFHGYDLGTGFVASGIYKYLNSPMYGLGNVQMYGLALIGNDWLALAVSLFFHVSIFTFNYGLEQPFVRRTYEAAKPVEETSALA